MAGRRIVSGLALAGLVVFVAACGSSSSSSKAKSATTSTTKASTSTTSSVKVAKQKNALLGPTQIKTLQTDLTTVGCFSGTVDGIIGPVTRAGISAFQTASGLTADGQYGSATEQKLLPAAQAGTKVCTQTPPTTTKPASAPPCTSAAILDAVRGSPSSGPNPSITDFGCDGGWAWAGVDINAGTDGYEATDLLKASGTAWTVVDRSKYCKPGQIPADVYNPGCTTN